jgi:hypothetical protein
MRFRKLICLSSINLINLIIWLEKKTLKTNQKKKNEQWLAKEKSLQKP